MDTTVEQKLTKSQESKLTSASSTLGSMDKAEFLKAFASRMNQICDEMGVPPKGKNRQASVGKIFGVSQKGARRWLEGEGMPELTTCYEIASWAGVEISWLLSGKGFQKAGPDEIELRLSQITVALPEDKRAILLNFITYLLEQDGRESALQVAAAVKRLSDLYESLKSPSTGARVMRPYD